MKKVIVFPAGRGIPYCVNAPDDISCNWIAKNIGCEWVETVRPMRLPRKFLMIVDEEGLLKDNSVFNPVGSWFYGFDLHGEPIVGNMMILSEAWGEEGPEFSGMTDEEVNEVFDILGRRNGNDG